jgi:hypothetical protein
MKKAYYLLAIAIICTNTLSGQSQTGNIGIDTPSARSKLTVNGNMSVGSSYTGIEAPPNGVIIQGNVGIGSSAATAKLHIAAGKLKITDGSQADKKILVSDPNGVGTWTEPPKADQFLAFDSTADTSVDLPTPWQDRLLPIFSPTINTIPGATYDAGTSSYFLPEGIYDITALIDVYNNSGLCPGFNINSLYMNFPDNGTTRTVLSDAPTMCGIPYRYTAQWVTTITIPSGGQSMDLRLGRGGNGDRYGLVHLSSNSKIVFRKIQ